LRESSGSKTTKSYGKERPVAKSENEND
jgi:hypothetical protein